MFFWGEPAFCLHRQFVFVVYGKCIMSSFLLLSNLFLKYLSYLSHSSLPLHPGKIKISLIPYTFLYLHILIKPSIWDPFVIGFLKKIDSNLEFLNPKVGFQNVNFVGPERYLSGLEDWLLFQRS